MPKRCGSAADRRLFFLETGDGVVRPIKGYRGDGQPLSRRGLPVYDARLLVNLVFTPAKGTFLDPFAGVGGIVLEAIQSGWDVLSADIDPALRHGLAHLGASHSVADARQLPIASASVGAIATEPPYDEQARDVLIPAFQELHRVLKVGGRLAVLCAAWQADALRQQGVVSGLTPYLDSPIDRKGVAVVALAWQK
jgi:SAM-dependent methyltransferase